MSAQERSKRYRDKIKTDPERREKYRQYKKIRYAKIKADPVKWAAHQRMKREEHKRLKVNIDPAEAYRRNKEVKRKWLEKIKSDPERYEDYLRNRREQQHAYREARREELSRKERERQAANPEAKSKANKQRRVANPDKVRKEKRMDYEKHVDSYKRRSRERRVRKVNAPGHHTEAEWQAIKSYYMDQCLSCGDVPDKLTPDHVIPLSKGGSDAISNIQPLCLWCNKSKGTKTIDYRI